MPKFLIKLPNGLETSLFTQEDDIFIGRIPSINDVCVNHPSVSRQHAHIKRREEGYAIYDLESLNGLYVNDERVSKAILQEGDQLKLGEVTIEVGFGEHSGNVTPQDLDAFEPTEVGIPVLKEKKPTKRKK